MSNIVYVNGAETRRRISDITGKKNGIRKICDEKGITAWSLNAICRKGFGTLPTIQRYIDAGIPVVISTDPKPNRVRREHTRARRATKLEPVILSETHDRELKSYIHPEPRRPKQLNFEDIEEMARSEKIRDILIDGLTTIVEELKKI
jgi:hypothetical protein